MPAPPSMSKWPWMRQCVVTAPSRVVPSAASPLAGTGIAAPVIVPAPQLASTCPVRSMCSPGSSAAIMR